MARKKAFVLIGDSQAEGLAGAAHMVLADTRLAPHVTTTPDVYDNINVFTSANDWPGPTGTPPTSTPGQGQWLEMVAQGSQTPTDPFPYPAPYQYPNTRSQPATPSAYFLNSDWTVGVELPLAWLLSHHWAEPIHMVKMAVTGSMLTRLDSGGGSTFHYGWLDYNEDFDWAPTTGRLYQRWIEKMTGAAAALGADKLDVRLVVIWLGDVDILANNGRGAMCEAAMRVLVNKVRQDLVTNDWTSLPKHQVAIVLMGTSLTASATESPIVDAGYQNIERDDPYLRFISTRDYNSLADDNLGVDDLHYGHTGYLQAAQDITDALIELETLGEDALSAEDRLTREDVRNRVLIYYTRGRSSTDATPEVVNQHINGALWTIFNRLGDNAWWLERMANMALSGGPTTTITLPRFVHRLLNMESVTCPDYPVKFEQQGHTDAGRVQILLKERYTGTFKLFFITRPKELSRDDELIPLPYNLIEWLVVETVKRLARASGNLALQSSLAGESEQMFADCMRDIQASNRARKDRLYAQRRLPTRRTLNGRWPNRWW